MEWKKKRSVGDLVVGFWMLGHVEPIILILTVVALFAVRATWPRPPWTLILLLLAGQTAMQFSIGILNDYCDRHLERARWEKQTYRPRTDPPTRGPPGRSLDDRHHVRHLITA